MTDDSNTSTPRYSWLPRQGRASRAGKRGGRPRMTVYERLRECAREEGRTMVVRTAEARELLEKLTGERGGE